MNLLQQIEQKNVKKLMEGKEIPEFDAGDTVRVHVKVVEGERERVQPFEGVVIGRKRRGINSSFRVRKMSHGEGVERVFPLLSPNIRIEVIRRGSVRRAKIYYLRDLTGKKARIAERAYVGPQQLEEAQTPEAEVTKAPKAAKAPKVVEVAEAAPKDEAAETPPAAEPAAE